MALTLMYVTGDPNIARVAEAAGVDWIFVDLEILGKVERQGHLDTVISGHTIEDVRAVRAVINDAEVMVRINPPHAGTSVEIEEALEAGADLIMLPFFTTAEEVRGFIEAVDGRAKTVLLVETPAAAEDLAAISAIPGIDHVHIGLNDLHLELGMDFMFELVANGMVEELCDVVKGAGIPYGFGGLARLGAGDLPAERVLAEHVRLGSSAVILARSFYDVDQGLPEAEVEQLFRQEVRRIREAQDELAEADEAFFRNNQQEVKEAVALIAERIRARRGQRD